jgi:hypothetical protein
LREQQAQPKKEVDELPGHDVDGRLSKDGSGSCGAGAAWFTMLARSFSGEQSAPVTNARKEVDGSKTEA